MYVVRVMPIARAAFKDSLSFFSKEPLEPGMVVDTVIRGRTLPALVLGSVEAREEKSSLKRQPFALKKVSGRGARRVFSGAVIRAASEAARRSGVAAGIALAHFSPPGVLASSRVVGPSEAVHGSTVSDVLALQAERDERVSFYRNATREAFARGHSVIVIAATVPEAEALAHKLSRGIEEQVILLTGRLAKRALLFGWNRAVESGGPLLVVATPQFLTLPSASVETVIVERESARGFVGREREALDARVMAEEVARALGARLILADFPVRVETRFRLVTHAIEEAARPQAAARDGVCVRVVDMKRKKDEREKKRKPFFSISDYARDGIEKEAARGGRVVLYAARRGLAPLTVCNDCGTPVTDPATGAPMTLEKTESGNVFIAHRSGAVIPSETPCRLCGGWNLVSLGIGVERVEEDARKLFPGHTILSLTAESAPTDAKAKQIRDRFFGSAGSILIGTDRMIPYLDTVERTVVTSVDGMLSSPVWRAEEYALHTLFALRDRTEEELILQTREAGGRVVRAVSSGNPTEFFETELMERKRFGYPPFATFIGLTWTGTMPAVKKIETLVKEELAGLDLVGPLPAHAIGRERYRSRAVIRLEESRWPDEEVARRLADLPPSVAIAVDPDEIV